MAKETYFIGFYSSTGTNDEDMIFNVVGKQLAGCKQRAIDLFRFKNSEIKINGLYINAIKIEALPMIEYGFLLQKGQTQWV